MHPTPQKTSSKHETYSYLEKMHDNVVILNGQGVILWVSPSCEITYGIARSEMVGKTALEMEQKKVYYPSVAVKVLKTKKKETVLEHSKTGRKLVVTGVPLFNDENEIERIISYSFDVTYLTELKEQYDVLVQLVERYSAELQELRDKVRSFPNIIANSIQMSNVIQVAIKVASVDTNVMITGETGVGKNVIARLIHENSWRKNGPFIEINCGAIPENLLESELFGYEDGAFTGARKKGKMGMIELAQEGTLFLDEIGEIPLNLQIKLLKIIQDKSLFRVGGTKSINVNFRLVTATNKDLPQLVKGGHFREDLYYRLCVVPINIPPLRERPNDILPLLQYFLKQFNNRYQKNKVLSNQVINILIKYSWPGNVRQLQNIIEQLVVMTDENNILPYHLIDSIKIPDIINSDSNYTLGKMLEDYEGQIIRNTYAHNKTTVGLAKALGISQASAVRKIKKYLTNSIHL